MKGDLRYWRIQRTSVPGYDFAGRILQVSCELRVRLAHDPCSEAVGNVSIEDAAAPWSLKGECGFGVPLLGYLVIAERNASQGKVHVRIVNSALFIVRKRVIKDLERRKAGSFLTSLGRRKFLGSHWKQLLSCVPIQVTRRRGTPWWLNPGLRPIFVTVIRQHEPRQII